MCLVWRNIPIGGYAVSCSLGHGSAATLTRRQRFSDLLCYGIAARADELGRRFGSSGWGDETVVIQTAVLCPSWREFPVFRGAFSGSEVRQHSVPPGVAPHASFLHGTRRDLPLRSW